ncbi:MAG: hypothetical protein HYS86_05380 [Candidatus Chisholmbacteria bacterium]|nr:hypothetical protein [Candidatus Chisholmbacteria bacterium]
MSETIRNNWSINELLEETQRRGKNISPYQDFQEFLAQDLAAGASVLWDEADVDAAIQVGIALPEWKDLLVKLTSTTFAVIRPGALGRWQQSNLNVIDMNSGEIWSFK